MALLNGQLPDSLLVTVGVDAYGRPARLRPEAAASWNRMRAAGMPHDVADTYRDLERQRAYEKNPPNSVGLAAKAGTSVHGWGLAVDARGACLAWLATHGRAHGWIRTIKAEPWHFEYRADLDTHATKTTPEPATTVPVEGDDMRLIRDATTGSIALIGEAYAGEFGGGDQVGLAAHAAIYGAWIDLPHDQYVTAVDRARGRMNAARAAVDVTALAKAVAAALPQAAGITPAQVATAVRAVIDGARITTN